MARPDSVPDRTVLVPGHRRHEFARPGALPDVDMQRGYFEVFAEEALPCAPTTGDENGATAETAISSGYPNAAN